MLSFKKGRFGSAKIQKNLKDINKLNSEIFTFQGKITDLLEKSCKVIIFYRNEYPIGIAITRWLRSQQISYLLNFGITPTFQNKGYGKMLWKELCEECDHYFRLEVEPSRSRAINFYEKMGATRMKIKGDFIHM